MGRCCCCCCWLQAVSEYGSDTVPSVSLSIATQMQPQPATASNAAQYGTVRDSTAAAQCGTAVHPLHDIHSATPPPHGVRPSKDVSPGGRAAASRPTMRGPTRWRCSAPSTALAVLLLLLVGASSTAYCAYSRAASPSSSVPSLFPSLLYYAALLPLTLPACLIACYAHWAGRKLFTHN